MGVPQTNNIWEWTTYDRGPIQNEVLKDKDEIGVQDCKYNSLYRATFVDFYHRLNMLQQPWKNFRDVSKEAMDS